MGQFTRPPPHVRVDCTDTGDRVWVQIGRFSGTDPEGGKHHDERRHHVVADPGVEPDAVVDGPAAASTPGCGGAATTPRSASPARGDPTTSAGGQPADQLGVRETGVKVG